MKEMTELEALAEAARQWGARGTVTLRPGRPTRKGPRGRLARYRCTVGNGRAEGQGHTWREAFADAARSDDWGLRD